MTLEWTINYLIDAVRNNNTADILKYSDAIQTVKKEADEKLRELYFEHNKLKTKIKDLVS